MTESVLQLNRERRKLSVLLVINYDKSSQTLWIGQQRSPPHPFYCQEPGANHQLALVKQNSKNAKAEQQECKTNNYHVSEAQKEMKKKYVNNGYAFVLSNDYDKICKNIHDYMKGIRVPCKYCIKHFYDKDTLKTHYKVIHRLSN